MRDNILLFHTVDLIANTSIQIEESLKDVQKGSVLLPKKRDTIGIGLPTRDRFGPINPLHLESMFLPVELKQPDMLPLLQEVPVKIRNRIAQAKQQTHKINSARVQEWHVKVDSAYKYCYSVSVELIDGAMEDQKLFAKFSRALDLHC